MLKDNQADFGAENIQTDPSAAAVADRITVVGSELSARPKTILGLKTGGVEPIMAHHREVQVGAKPPEKVFRVLLPEGDEQKKVYIGEVVPATEALARIDRMLEKVISLPLRLKTPKRTRLESLKSVIARILNEDAAANIVWREKHYGGKLPGIVRPEGKVIRSIPQGEAIPPTTSGVRRHPMRQANIRQANVRQAKKLGH